MSDTPVEGLPRRERRKLEIRTRLVEAATELFLEKGVAGTRVSAICERADTAQQTFFNYFPTKRHVVREMARLGTEELLGQIEAARKQGRSTRERIRRFFEGVAESAEDSGPMQRELLTEIIHASYEAGSEPEQARRLHEAFAAIVRDGLDAGDVTTAHGPETLTELLLGSYYVLMFSYANLSDFPLQERARAQAQLVADALAPSQDRERRLDRGED